MLNIPSWTSWCALQMSFKWLVCMNSLVTDWPNSHPAPLGLTAQESTSSGSDQTKSQNAPDKKNVNSERNWCVMKFYVTFVWNFLISVDESNMVQSPNVRRQSTMNTKYLFVNQCSNCKKVKDPATVAPSISIAVFRQTFVVKPIDLRNLSWLVVSAQKGNTIEPLGLKG